MDKMIFSNLSVYGIAHALVDATCAGVIFSIFRNDLVDMPYFFDLIVLYGFLAFGMQSILGLWVDYFRSPRLAALFGCILTGGSALIFMFSPMIAVIFAGLGNALFHLGGGVVALNLIPGKATAPGIYVAPGALGLFVGTMLGNNGAFVVWQFILALLIISVLIFIVPKPVINYVRKQKDSKAGYFWIVFIFIFLAISIRSLVGFILVFPWKSDLNLAVILTVGVVLGKALGGVMADRIGWIKVAVGASLLSIPFLVFAPNIPLFAIIGVFLFNMTMSITLVALSTILPGRPAFAFGLTCLALIIGAAPTFLGYKSLFTNSFLVFAIIVASASFLNTGIQILFQNKLSFEDSLK